MKKIVFMGTPDFSVPILEKLLQSYNVQMVVTQPDRPTGRRQKLTPPPVKKLAQKYQLSIFQPENIKENYEPIEKLNPDLIITAAYGQLLPKKLLQLPKFGCINVHASLLPELRGGAPIHHAILQGKKVTGVTIMEMVEKLDAGDILTKVEVDIEKNDTVGSLHDKLSDAGSRLLIETLPKLFKNEINPVPQDEKKATYGPNITREDEWIDWQQSAETIYNQIRGLCPWPVAYTKYEGENIKIWSAQLKDDDVKGKPGEIIQVLQDNSGVVISTKDGKGIVLTEIQRAGRRKMSMKEYLLGNQNYFEIGKVLG